MIRSCESKLTRPAVSCMFTKVLGSSFNGVMERDRLVYNLRSNRLLDDVLGLKWDKRIFNICGDFAYVIEGTVKFSLGKKSPIVECKVVGRGKYVKSEIDDNSQVVLTFVRGDGNSLQYV